MKVIKTTLRGLYHAALLTLIAFAVFWLAAPTKAQEFVVASQTWVSANFCDLTGCVMTGEIEFPSHGS